MVCQTEKIYSLITPYCTIIAFTITNADPVGPGLLTANSASDAVTGNPPADVVTAKLAFIDRELLVSVPTG